MVNSKITEEIDGNDYITTGAVTDSCGDNVSKFGSPEYVRRRLLHY